MEALARHGNALVIVSDDDPFSEYSATSGDYFMFGLDDDLNGDLAIRRTVLVDPENIERFDAFVSSLYDSVTP